MREGKDMQGLLVWGATALVALVILGACIVIARNNAAHRETPAVAAPAALPLPAQSPPAPGRESAAGQEEQPPPPVRSAPARVPQPGTGSAQLQLDHLAGTLKLNVPFLARREKIPLENTCFRNNMSPAMGWTGAPPDTGSYVVFLERRTPAEEPPFVGWILFDIPANAGGLQDDLPKTPVLPGNAKHANSDHGNIGYSGPCDPRGEYTYALRVFALDRVLNLPPGVDKDTLIRAMNGHIIDAAEKQFIHYHKK